MSDRPSNTTAPGTEIIVEDARGALAWVGDEIVYLTKERLCADCGHPINGREIDPTPKVSQ